jgi:hypothetical protein
MMAKDERAVSTTNEDQTRQLSWSHGGLDQEESGNRLITITVGIKTKENSEKKPLKSAFRKENSPAVWGLAVGERAFPLKSI